ncbi:cytochrome P450 [Nocardia sp. CDC159]|uniref:Cytochrome P450 n=1 Tax=Nocardia pulmonis TaxID=2951408 RepID=A0A9X2E916_9NOCA|nr:MULTISPECIES: cytochrome P450 [Nocardia]MCM6776372.1 cytochrome P450 [Nocardia pulmonis]MCM6788796.1 cytochrome P450 [Nocardia sp. CDC159]
MTVDDSTLSTAPAPPRSRTVLPLSDAIRFRDDPLAFMTEFGQAYGEVAEFRIGAKPAVLVSGARQIRDVLAAKAGDFDKGDLQRNAVTPVLGRGLLISEGRLHDVQRKMVAPLFAARRLGPHIDRIGGVIARHLDEWESLGRFELIERVHRITHDAIAELLIGGPTGDEDRLAAGVTRVFDWEMKRLFSVAAPPLWLPTPNNRRLRADLADIRGKVRDFIAERRGRGTPDDLVTALLLARDDDGRPMSDEQLVDEVINLWGTSYETNADGQFWAAYSMWRHPEIAERVRAEAEAVCADRPPGIADLARLPYAAQVFKEAVRLYPPSALLLREAVRDTEIGGYRIKRGSLMLLAIFAMHRSPRYYEDPLEFRPERFDPALEKSRDRYAYLPFGAGRHVCLGSSLAVMQGQMFTALLASRGRLEFHVDGPVHPQLLINLRPRGSTVCTYGRRVVTKAVPR